MCRKKWLHRPLHPLVNSCLCKKGSRRIRNVVGLRARQPQTHWSNVAAWKQANLHNCWITSRLHIELGSLLSAQTGKAGCSRNPEIPLHAATSSSCTRNWINFVPMTNCLWALRPKALRPHGCWKLLIGWGPPGSNLAADHVSHEGPPPIPITCPDAIRAVHQSALSLSVRSEWALAKQISIEMQKMCNWPTMWCCSIWCWRSPLRLKPLKKCTNTLLSMLAILAETAGPIKTNSSLIPVWWPPWLPTTKERVGGDALWDVVVTSSSAVCTKLQCSAIEKPLWSPPFLASHLSCICRASPAQVDRL